MTAAHANYPGHTSKSTSDVTMTSPSSPIAKTFQLNSAATLPATPSTPRKVPRSAKRVEAILKKLKKELTEKADYGKL